MTRWQRRARLLIAVFGVVFAVFVALAVQAPRPAPAPLEPCTHRSRRRRRKHRRHGRAVQRDRAKTCASSYDKQLAYADGIEQADRRHHRHRRAQRHAHLHRHREGGTRRPERVDDRRSTATSGSPRRDGLTVDDRARDLRRQRRHRARARARSSSRAAACSGTGIGMTYDKTQRRADASSTRPSCTSPPTTSGAGAADVTSGTADVRAARQVHALRARRADSARAARSIEADTARRASDRRREAASRRWSCAANARITDVERRRRRRCRR